ncbi:MAG: GGDEF domain-containing protein [Gammaproteobacteria bacterium]|nr:GGDEF domain-containing protein [Gammaproteobacteria bacterium]
MRCLLDARYVRELELKLRRIQRSAAANRRLALTDRLTGLPNRRHLELHLDRVLVHGALRPLSLVLFDVDDFKRFNDRHGYPAGDRVLAAVATVFGKASANAFAARLGGDEFVVIFGHMSAGRVRSAADRLARAVARHPLLSPHGVTVSFGLTALYRWQDALAAADRDLRRRRAAARPLPADRGFRYLWAQVLGVHGLPRAPQSIGSPPPPDLRHERTPSDAHRTR